VYAGHWLGSKKGAGHVGKRRDREIRRRARVRTRRSTTSVEGAELTGQAHDEEREERGARGNGSATGDPGSRDREGERERAGEVTGANRSAPAGRDRRPLIALPTIGAGVVGSPDSPVNFSHGVHGDPREQRVHLSASLGTEQCPVHPQLVLRLLLQLKLLLLLLNFT
jgi:hypothetical protein